MAISPIILNGTIQQTHDVLQNQTRETHKGMIDQGNIYVQEQKKEQQRSRQVVHSDDTRFREERFDAKEKGHGSYQGNGGKNRKHQETNDKIVLKPEGGFDVKI